MKKRVITVHLRKTLGDKDALCEAVNPRNLVDNLRLVTCPVCKARYLQLMKKGEDAEV